MKLAYVSNYKSIIQNGTTFAYDTIEYVGIRPFSIIIKRPLFHPEDYLENTIDETIKSFKEWNEKKTHIIIDKFLTR